MGNIFKQKNFYFIFFTDLFLVGASYVFSYLLRFEGQIPVKEWENIYDALIYVIPIKLSIFFVFNLYRGMWRYTGINDLKNVIKSASVSSVVLILIVLFVHRFHGYPRSVYIIDWILTFVLVAGIRVFTRLYFGKRDKHLFKYNSSVITGNKKLLIIGAGDAGEKTLRELKDNHRLNYEIIGFVDDDEKKIGKSIHGITVLGDIQKLPDFCKRLNIDELLISIPTAKGKKMRRIVELCEKSGCKFRTLPMIGDIIGGKVEINRIRAVSYEDLLGRETVKLDEYNIAKYLKGKIVLVTGGAGSIGAELCRQINRFKPAKIIVCDKTENSIYHKEWEFKETIVNIEILLADVTHYSHMDHVFSKFKPQVVFHAAAFKHVPIVELHPSESIYNNIMGTHNILKLSKMYKVERFVLVSTDKAVRSENVMGATKRVAELLTQAYDSICFLDKDNNGNKRVTVPHFMCVRFGNVLGSEGSVVPLFKKQIEKGGPVTVTHPEITRYFMSIDEAAQLILQAGAMANGGEIFILDMGKPIKIVDMVRDLVRLSGLEVEDDIQIKFIGLRPGEKLYEELITEGEGISRTVHEKILVIKNKKKSNDLVFLNKKIEELIWLAERFDNVGIKMKLKEIVPEYQPKV